MAFFLGCMLVFQSTKTHKVLEKLVHLKMGGCTPWKGPWKFDLPNSETYPFPGFSTIRLTWGVVACYPPHLRRRFITLPETNSKRACQEAAPQKETIVFQPSIFRCEMLVSGRVSIPKIFACNIRLPANQRTASSSRDLG